MKKVKWGILGAGKIAHRFASSLMNINDVELYAIAVRNINKGNKFAEKFSCSKIYTNYDEFLEDSNIDCVYIALPHSLHYKYSLIALRKGK